MANMTLRDRRIFIRGRTPGKIEILMSSPRCSNKRLSLLFLCSWIELLRFSKFMKVVLTKVFSSKTHHQ